MEAQRGGPFLKVVARPGEDAHTTVMFCASAYMRQFSKNRKTSMEFYLYGIQ